MNERKKWRRLHASTLDTIMERVESDYRRIEELQSTMRGFDPEDTVTIEYLKLAERHCGNTIVALKNCERRLGIEDCSIKETESKNGPVRTVGVDVGAEKDSKRQ